MLKVDRLLTYSLLAGALLVHSPQALAQQDPAAAKLLPVGVSSPDFTALTWNGSNAHLSDYRGRIVVLDFWAPWCGPCNQAMPHLQAIHAAYHDDNVVVLGLCVDDTAPNANTWVKAHPEDTFTFLLDPAGQQSDSLGPDSDICAHYGIVGIPTTYIIGTDGRIAARGVDMQQEQIAAALKRLGARTAEEKTAVQHMADDIKQADAQDAAAVKASHPKAVKSRSVTPAAHAVRRSKKSRHAA